MDGYFYYILCKREWNDTQNDWIFPEKNFIFFKIKARDWKDSETELYDIAVSLYGNSPEIPFKIKQIAKTTFNRHKIYKDRGQIDNEFMYIETYKSTLPIYIKPEIIIRKTLESYIVNETKEITDFFNEINKIGDYNDD